MWVKRTWCSILEELRECYKTRNFAPMMGLLEELQTAGNRMEAGLEQKADLKDWDEEWHQRKKEIKALRKEQADLEKVLGKKKEKKNKHLGSAFE